MKSSWWHIKELTVALQEANQRIEELERENERLRRDRATALDTSGRVIAERDKLEYQMSRSREERTKLEAEVSAERDKLELLVIKLRWAHNHLGYCDYSGTTQEVTCDSCKLARKLLGESSSGYPEDDDEEFTEIKALHDAVGELEEALSELDDFDEDDWSDWPLDQKLRPGGRGPRPA